MEVEEKKGFFKKIKKEIIDHKWLCIMCGAAVLLILTVLLIPVNNGKSILYNVISSTKENNKNFSIVSIKKKSDGKYINNNEDFVVITKNGTLDEVKKHLYLEPALNYDIEKEKQDQFIVKLRDVPRDTLININYITDEVVDHRWAFQSDKDFKVTSVYPANESTDVGTYSTIEVVLSMAVNDDFSEKISIEPKVEGTFEQVGRVIRFKPSKELSSDTKYTIHVEKGYECNGLVMEEDFTSTFSTYKYGNDSTDYSTKYSSITIDNINTFKVGEPPIFKLFDSYENNVSIGKITISKFKNFNNFMKYLNKEKDYDIEDLGEYKYTTNPLYKKGIVLEKGLEQGYYLENVYLTTGELYTSIPTQVHELSAFAFTSDRDLLVWVGSNNKLLENIEISYKDQKFKTDKDGIGILKNYNTREEKMNYVFVGDKNPLIIGVNNDDNIRYPFAYLYTDRPLYKNTDTVNIWGFVPLSYFEDEFNKDDLVLTLGDKPITLSVDSNGIISTKLELDNYKDDYYCLDLTYKTKSLDYRCFEVSNYQNQIYSYNINSDKNYVYAGQDFEFDVEINHVSGVTVSNKEVIASYNNKDYRGVTDDRGIAHFSIKTEKNKNDGTNVSYETISIKNSDVLYNNYSTNYNFYKIERLINCEGERSSNITDKKIKLKLYDLDNNSKEDNIEIQNYEKNLKKFISNNYEGNVIIRIEENDYKRTQTGTYYNEFTKENLPRYTFSSIRNTIKTDNVYVKDGLLEYTGDFEEKKSDADNTYSYSYYILVKDKNGDTYEIDGWFSSKDKSSESEYSKGYINPHDIYYSEGSYDYNAYRYYLDSQSENKIYSVNDKMDFVLKNYLDEIINAKGKVLEIKYKNRIIDTYLYDSTEDVTNTFNKKDEPGMDIAGAYYIDDKFYRLPNDYYDYKKEDSLVDISIKTNKKDYQPRDEVEVEINTKDINGKGIGTNLNISVVDESVFNLTEDNTDILNTLHRNKYYYAYLYSSFRDYEMYFEGGGAGSTSGPDRFDFGDTIYFKNITTDSNGNAKIKFKLNDSITSFRITVHAANTDNKVGAAKKNINSKLPLSISYTEPKGLKSSDDFVLNANILGTENDNVEVTFEVEGKDKKIVNTAPGKTAYANFGKLDVGTYNVRISAKNKEYTDAVKFQVPVILTQEEIAIKTTKNVSDNKSLKVKRNPVTIELYRGGMSKYLNYLDKMKNYEKRLDTILSSRQSMYYENKYYGSINGIVNNDLSEFQYDNYLRYLPNEETSVVLTALVNYYTPGIFEIKKPKIYERLNNEYVTKDFNKVVEYYLLLASMKEPVLDDLKKFVENKNYGDDEHQALLILAFALIGDYDTAKELYSNSELIIDEGLRGIIATFIEKNKATKYIDFILNSNISNRYVYFAMMSYFMNNNAKLSEKEEVTVNYGNNKKEIVLEGLKIAKLEINQKDLKSLKFDTKYTDILVNYYYQGELDKDNENVHEEIKMTLDKKSYKVGEYATLKIDTQGIDNRNGMMRVYLPNSLRLSGNIVGDGFLSSNRTDNLILYLSAEIKYNSVEIPLYITSPGKYKIDPIVYKINDTYYISNELEINVE